MLIHFLNTREDQTTLSYFARDTVKTDQAPQVAQAYRGGPGK